MNKKMELLKKAEKVNYVFDKMDNETQEAIKGLINHLMVAKEVKKLKKNEKSSWLMFAFLVYLGEMRNQEIKKGVKIYD